MTTVSYFWLKCKNHPRKEPVIADNALLQATSSVSIYAFRDISSIILHYLYLTLLICTDNYLREPVYIISCRH